MALKGRVSGSILRGSSCVMAVLLTACLTNLETANSVSARVKTEAAGPVAENGADLGPTIIMVIDLFPGGKSSEPREMRAAHGSLYFMARGPGVGYEPWVTDGTSTGTTLIGDLHSGPAWVGARAITSTANGTLLALQSEGEHFAGSLWFTTTTAAAAGVTMAVVDWGPRFATKAVRFEDEALVWFSDLQETSGLWRTDGTTEGTRLIKAGMFAYAPRLVKAGDRVFFLDSQSDLAITDGTTAGTRHLHTWGGAGQGGSSMVAMGLAAAGRLAFFHVRNARAIGDELWVSDGTPDGTRLVKDINPGPASARPSWLTRRGSDMFFVADDGKNGRELWRSDGTAAGTVRITDQTMTRMPDVTHCRGRVYFITMDENEAALWSTRGNAGDLRRIAGLPMTSGKWREHPRRLTCIPGGLLFTADDGVHGREPWTWSEEAQTLVLHDLMPGQLSSRPEQFKRVGNRVYLQARDGQHGKELWVVTP